MSEVPTSRTVFFGPFVGEFGWEVMRWQGWVRRMLQSRFQGWRAVVSSLPGRQVLYPASVEFWPIDEEFASLGVSQRNYITDGWVGDLPEVYTFKKHGFLGWHFYTKKRLASPVQNVRDEALRVLTEAQAKLPQDTLSFVPWLQNEFEGMKFGVRVAENPRGWRDFQTMAIPYEAQTWEKFVPSEQARLWLSQQGVPDNLVCIFPRARSIRRPDKNWPEEQYLALIEHFQSQGHPVAVLGSPGGCYFEGGVPKGVWDLIQVPSEIRTDVHVAAVERSILSLGSISGALVFAAACGGKVLTWSDRNLQKYIYRENVLASPVLCYPEIAPTVGCIADLAKEFLKRPDAYAFGKSFFQGAPA